VPLANIKSCAKNYRNFLVLRFFYISRSKPKHTLGHDVGQKT
jgi:hypothetical protein